MITFRCRELMERVGHVFLSLIGVLHQPLIRNHPIWGRSIPFATANYGDGISSRYCIRPDVVVTERDGELHFEIVEFNIFPAGRGITLTGLDDSEKHRFLVPFAEWYSTTSDPCCYAVGTDQMWRSEAEYFSDQLRRHTGVNVPAINIDEQVPAVGIDRLFQPFQCAKGLNGSAFRHDIFPREGWLDAKTILALIHDSQLDGLMPTEELQVLRSVVPETRLFDRKFMAEVQQRAIRPGKVLSNEEASRLINAELAGWMIKNGGIDDPKTFGSRGVDPVSRLSKSALKKIEDGVGATGHERFGRFPIIQRISNSICFRNERDRALSERSGCRPEMLLDFSPTPPDSRSSALGRLGIFLLLAPGSPTPVRVVPYAGLCIGPSRVVHGAKDCVTVPAEIV